ncbi:hypothetical protein FA13DRAFT_1520356 [Coprinellus micaceus]|uniref:Uncharacterized protein n=1 Tax=Coprinellus micaceus TaxID=71717 RepID=A0A4Y7SK40_COPMI|nr:hypothetical protein FA13DRAFT_1520356 [Coprinellus micaceus]
MSQVSSKSDKRIRDLADGATTDNITLSKLKTALEYCELMQAERPYIESKDEALAVTACLYILHLFLKASLDRPSLHSAALPHLLQGADAALYWLDVGIRLYTDNKPVYFPTHVADYITALHNLFDFDPKKLRPLLVREPMFFDLILSLWHPREQDFAWTFLDNPKTPNDAPCPVVCLFRAVVQDGPTRAALFDHVSIHHPRRGTLLLAQGTMCRAERSLSARYSTVLSYKKLFYVYYLVSIMWSLCEDNPPMRRRFTHTCLAPETFSRVLERHIRNALQGRAELYGDDTREDAAYR